MELEFKTLEIRKIGKEEVNSVLASELYMQLGIKKDFTDWMKAQIKRGMFEENFDFMVVWNYPQDGGGYKIDKPVSDGLPEGEKSKQSAFKRGWSYDYILSPDTAKEIAMMSQTEKGKEIRKYFIKVEKIAKDVLGEKKLELELKKMENNVELDYIKGKLEIAQMLQGLGANFDPIALANEGKFVSKLPQDIGEVLTDAMSDIRVGIRTFSATHLLAENGVDILTRDFNSVMILAGLMEEYTYRGKIYRRFTNKYNWYGYNQDSSSIKELPYLIKYYEDRFLDLVQLLRNEGYID